MPDEDLTLIKTLRNLHVELSDEEVRGALDDGRLFSALSAIKDLEVSSAIIDRCIDEAWEHGWRRTTLELLAMGASIDKLSTMYLEFKKERWDEGVKRCLDIFQQEHLVGRRP